MHVYEYRYMYIHKITPIGTTMLCAGAVTAPAVTTRVYMYMYIYIYMSIDVDVYVEYIY